MPGESYVQSFAFSEMENGDTRTEIVSPFEIRMDLRGTEGGDDEDGRVDASARSHLILLIG